MCAASPLSHQNKHADFHEVKLFKNEFTQICQCLPENINDLNGEILLLKGGDMSIDFIPAMGWEK